MYIEASLTFPVSYSPKSGYISYNILMTFKINKFYDKFLITTRSQSRTLIKILLNKIKNSIHSTHIHPK